MGEFQDKNRIKLELEKCIDQHSHEGEWNVLGHTIVVFRSTATNNVCGFVDTNYWTGWYGAEPGYDLKRVMMDICEFLFKYPVIPVIINGELDMDIDPKKPIKNDLYEDLKKVVHSYEGDLTTLKFTVNKVKGIYKATFKAGMEAAKELIYGKGSTMFNHWDYNEINALYNGEMTCTDPELNDFLIQAFTYSFAF